ncbi:MAG: DarT ssDNA thymidine ADP-ribosyltransferase family protein [Planctomycetia bacterium]|nr:DarT ssDNA thymidine ADP-ribosyltransferase family protein [Planctomycetia bacterium]
MKAADIRNLYYITHIDNVASIVERGLLSHAEIDRQQVPYTRIYDDAIVSRRKEKRTPEGRSLWEYANLYFQARNPMMYRVIHEKGTDSLAVIAVRRDVMNTTGVVITDGNAASEPTQFFDLTRGMNVLSANWKTIQNEWWRGDDGSKRKIMAECLVPGRVGPECIEAIYVQRDDVKKKLDRELRNTKLPVIPEPRMFFRPWFTRRIGENISLIEGDMFFSNRQTFTISVNLQGIMGKGLASRAKYQFPDVYVEYQDACRSRRLRSDRPFLYKRESSLEEDLAEDLGRPLERPNAVKWFLLFATKRKWRENSRLEDIEAGLSWVRTNAVSEGIQSLALPALGCGLGNLDWRVVGPLMCRYLHRIGFEVAIYLPRESKVPPESLDETFLLGNSP